MSIKQSLFALAFSGVIAGAQTAASRTDCADLAKFQMPGVVVTKAEPVAAAGGLPAYCRVDGAIDRRTGVGGKQYAIGFALALPDQWNGRFLFQGGGGLNGNVAAPVGGQAAGDVPALARGFAVMTTDSGHRGAVFDGSFFEDQQASLDFYYVAIGHVTLVAKNMIEARYGRAADHSYYDGCSTGGREAMIMTQRYPAYFDGVIAGDPAIRTGYSNLNLAYIGATFDRAAPRDASGKPGELFSAADRELIRISLLNQCDAKDGLQDGMINFKACDFDPTRLACSSGQTGNCLAPEKAAALKKAFGGAHDVRGGLIYPGFPYDAGIAEASSRLPGLLFGPRIPVPVPTDSSTFDAGRESARIGADANARLGDSTWTNLATFSRARRQTALLSRAERPLVLAARHPGVLRKTIPRQRRPGTSGVLEPVIPGAGHGALPGRQCDSRPLRYADRHH